MSLERVQEVLRYAETERSFFGRVERHFSRFSDEFKLIEQVHDDSQDAFVEVYRENGKPYFTHVRSVAIIVLEYLHICERRGLSVPPHEILGAAMSHDNVEDRPDIWTLDRVARDYTRRMAWLMDYVSKRPKVEFGGDKVKQLDFYHSRFATAPIEFFLVKLPDRLHNQMTIWSCDEEKIRRKARETDKYYLPYARQWGILAHELEATTFDLNYRIEEHIKKCKIK